MIVSVKADGVVAMQGNNMLAVDELEDGMTYQIRVWNTTGAELPNTGGPGDAPWRLVGLLFVVFALVPILRRVTRLHNA